MTKKIIIASILILAVAIIFTACKKDDYEVSFTVPMENGEDITVFQDEDGNEFVTNTDGDKIPVTTDDEGFYDDITSLITETTTKKSSSNKTTTTTKPADDKTTTTTTTKPADDKTTTTTTKPADDKTTTTTTVPDINFGDKNKTDDSVEWSDIVNAGKN